MNASYRLTFALVGLATIIVLFLVKLFRVNGFLRVFCSGVRMRILVAFVCFTLAILFFVATWSFWAVRQERDAMSAFHDK